MVNKEDIKLFCRIDLEDETNDKFIESLIDTAYSLIYQKTGKTYIDGNKIYDLCVKFLVATWYDNRQPISSTTVNEVPYTVQNLLIHLLNTDAIDDELIYIKV